MGTKYRFESEVLKSALEVSKCEGEITLDGNSVHIVMDITEGEFFEECPEESPLETVINNICKVRTLSMTDDATHFDNYSKDSPSTNFIKNENTYPINLSEDLLVSVKQFWDSRVIAVFNEDINGYELMAEGYGKIGRIFFPSKKPNDQRPLEAKFNFSPKFLDDVPYKTNNADFTRVFAEKILLSNYLR